MDRKLPKIMFGIFCFAMALAPVWADLVSIPYVFVAGQTLPAAQLNADFATIYNGFNGNITNINIKNTAAIAFSKLATMSAGVLGNPSGTASPSAITFSSLTNLLNVFNGTQEGVVPNTSGNDATKYLDGTGAFSVPPGSGGVVGPGVQFNVPFYNAVGNTLTASTLMNINGGVLTLGNAVNTGEIIMNDSAGHSVTIQTAPSYTGNTNWGFPKNNGAAANLLIDQDTQGNGLWCPITGDITFTSSGTSTLATVNATTGTFANANITVNGKGLITAASAGSAGGTTNGFGGTGLDGATTTWTTPQLNASSLTVTGTTGPTAYGTPVVNATATVAFNNGAVVSLNGLGYKPGPSTASMVLAGQGTGPYGGMNSVTALVGGGGGGGAGAGAGAACAGGNGGGASGTNGGLGGGSNTTGAGYVFSPGSAGGSAIGTAAGAGGGKLTICALGAVSTATGAVVSANGTAGTNSGTNAQGGPGGGGGGFIPIYSQTSIALAAGTMTVLGGNGGSGQTTGDGGGGGGGGIILPFSPSNTINLVAATACAGGSGGGTGSGSNGAAGTAGTIIAITGTPSAPLISLIDKGGLREIVDHCRRAEIASIHGYDICQTQVCRWVCHSMNDYIACMESANVPLAHIRTAPIEIADRLRRIA